MRIVVLGAGAIGGVVGGRLALAGHDVTLVARGAHLDALQGEGLLLQSPTGTERIRLPAVEEPTEVRWRDGDVVLLTVKSQHTTTALAALLAAAPHTTPVVCLQNGVANEPAALRSFPRTYGASVNCPTSYLRPGAVQAWAAPITGLFDIGRYPCGTDAVSESVASALSGAGFDARSIADVRRWKYRKLLTNLGNAIEAVCGPQARHGQLDALLLAEGTATFAAAGIEAASAEEDRGRRGDLLRLGEIDGSTRPGGSSWQSLQRRTGDIETDYLNGEIVLLGRIHGVPTPGNELLQHLAWECATGRRAPCSVPESQLLTELRRDVAVER